MPRITYKKQVINNAGIYKGKTVVPLNNIGLVLLRGQNLDYNGYNTFDELNSPSNGSGKSTLLKLIRAPQFGLLSSTANATDIVNSRFSGPTEATLYFDIDNTECRIQLVRDKKEGNSYHMWMDGVRITPNKDLHGAARRAIKNQLPLTANEYDALIHLGINKQLLISGKKSDRRAYIERIYGLNNVNLILNEIKLRHKAVGTNKDDEIKAVKSALKSYKKELENATEIKTDTLDEIQKNIEKLEDRKEHISTKISKMERAILLRKKLSKLHKVIRDNPVKKSSEKLSKELDSLKERKIELKRALKKASRYKELKAEIKELGTGDAKQLRKQIKRQERKSQLALDKKDKAKKRYALVKAGKCPTCKRDFDVDNPKKELSRLKGVIKSCEEKAENHSERANALETLSDEYIRREKLEVELKALSVKVNPKKAAKQLEQTEERIDKCAAFLKEAATHESAVSKANKIAKALEKVPSENKIENMLKKAKSKRKGINTEIKKLSKQLGKAEERKKSAARIKASIADYEKRLQKLKDERNQSRVYDALRVAIGSARDNCLADVSSYVKKYLPFYVRRFFPEPNIKVMQPKDDDLPLDLVVERTFSDGKNKIKTGLLSQSEEERMNLAFLFTLRRLFNISNLTLFDESLSKTDSVGEDIALNIMRDESDALGLSQIVVKNSTGADFLTNKTEIFDSIWTARRRNGIAMLLKEKIR